MRKVSSGNCSKNSRARFTSGRSEVVRSIPAGALGTKGERILEAPYTNASYGLISGSGGLTKNSPGTLQLSGLVPNTYTGGTIVNNGTLHLGAIINGGSPPCANPAGTGSVTLNAGGTIQFDRVSASNALIVNGGTLYSSNGWGATWSGPIILNATLTCNASYILTLSNAISGTGGLTKTSNDHLILSGSNSYSGNTTVNAGTLQLNSANAGNNASTVTIAPPGPC